MWQFVVGFCVWAVFAGLVTNRIVDAIRDRRRLKRAEFSGALTHMITVPAGTDGRPGAAFLAPSLDEVAYTGSHGTSVAHLVLLGPRSSLALMFAERVGDQGTLAEFTETQLEADRVRRDAVRIVGSTPTTIGGSPAFTFESHLRRQRRLKHYHVARNGWVFAVVIGHFSRRTANAERLAAAVLDSWSWHDVPTGGQTDRANSSGRVGLIGPSL